jgi:hypothetical protein
LPSNNLNIQNYDIDLQFSGDNAYSYVEDQLDIGFRIPGTQERVNCANYFISKFKEIDSNFTYILHNFTTHFTECQNLLFKLNENYSNIVILGAHYDTRAKADKDDPNEHVLGANDGASGCAVLIELARVLYAKKENLSCEIWFLFFDAEDQGGNGIAGWDWCEGSQRFVSDLNNFYESETENFDCMILLDMVGGNNTQFINEQYSTSSLLNEMFAIGRELGYIFQFPSNPESASIVDDHLAFVGEGIPSADLIINFWDSPVWPYHHTTQDVISHISNTSLEITGNTVEQFLYNNYFDDPTNTYQGNYPWSQDRNLLDVNVFIILIIIIALIGISIVIWIFTRTTSVKEDELSIP